MKQFIRSNILVGVWALVFIVVNPLHTHAQETLIKQIDIQLSAGISNFRTNDQLINYFNYSGKSISPIQFSLLYQKEKNIFSIDFKFQQAKLYPENNIKVDYEYNFIQYQSERGGISYFREIFDFRNKFRFYLGAGASSHLDIQAESYLNWLYPVAGYRRSYSFSLLDLSPGFMLDYCFSKHQIQIKASSTILNLAARPTDNEVKQEESENKYRWKIYNLPQYSQTQLSVLYQYSLSKKTSLFAAYHFQYSSYFTTDGYKQLENSYSLGISKIFQF